MTNERYLVVSYFFAAAGALAIGLGAFLWLRTSLNGMAEALPWKAVRKLLVRLFPAGILFPALLGFLSVSYVGCKENTYEKIVANRSYLENKNAAQISASLIYVVYAVLVWCAFIAILLVVERRAEQRTETRSHGRE